MPLNLSAQSTYALKNMIKALSMMPALNSEEENKRLKNARRELRKRGARR